MLHSRLASFIQHLWVNPHSLGIRPWHNDRYFSVPALAIGIKCPITVSIIATASADDRFGIRESDACSAAGSAGESKPRLGDKTLALITVTVLWVGTEGGSGGHEMETAMLIL